VFGEDLQRAKSVGAWFKTVEPFVKDARPYADAGIVLGAPAADCPGFARHNTLWRHYDAKQRSTPDEALAIGDALARTGLFGELLYASESGGSWPESLARYRTILVPERALLDEVHAEQLRQYVKQGGRLIGFGHASMLDATGQRRDDYALADVFGAEYRGQVAFAPKTHKTQVKVDSEYSAEYAGPNLLEGTATAWASGGTPMPHWAEILLPEPVEVAKVELVSRSGPYLVTDIDIETREGEGWRLLKSVRDATSRVISVPLEEPVRTSRIRVTIRRELYQGEDRQYADVEAIRVFDKAGRDHATNRVGTIPLVEVAADLRAAFETGGLAFLPMAVEVEPTTAEVIARLETPGRSPAILRNRYGGGDAILITTGEGSFQDAPAFWSGLGCLAVGPPTLQYTEEAMARYRFILTRAGEHHVLHVIDRTAGSPGYEPGEVTVSLETARFGGLDQARLAGTDKPLSMRQDEGRATFTVCPDPVASVVLR